jgi:GNAT superfamily N-acetyltransferase
MVAIVNETAAGYPQELEAAITIADGRALAVRPIVPADASTLRAEFDAADEETLYMRFLRPRPSLDDEQLRRFVEVDYRWRLALTAWDGLDPVAIARYEGSPGSPSAEVAFVVKPAYRGLGVATALVALLENAATRAGITEFAATCLASNTGALGVLAARGFTPPLIQGGVAEATKRLG